MAFLMLLHEKMRLQRKQNKLTLKQLRNGNQLSRMESRIKKREKYYSKLEKQLETQANAMKNSMNMQISMGMGLGTNGVNLANPNGSNMCAQQILAQWNGTNQYSGGEYDPQIVQAILSGQYKQERVKGEDGTYSSKYTINGSTSITEEQYNSAQAAIQSANSAVSQMQAQASYMKSNYENNVSIWLQAAKEELEMQQEWEMDMLAEEQQDYESEKEAIAAELELVKQRKEAIEQELGSSIKDAAPKFGLA